MDNRDRSAPRCGHDALCRGAEGQALIVADPT
jgi:hypothetical protein